VIEQVACCPSAVSGKSTKAAEPMASVDSSNGGRRMSRRSASAPIQSAPWQIWKKTERGVRRTCSARHARAVLDPLYRVNVEILEMSGPREDISLLGDHESSIRLITKDDLVDRNMLD
jgi:hypothetical protein